MAPLVTMDRARAAVAAALLVITVVAYWTLRPGVTPKPAAGTPQAATHNAASRDPDGVDLSDSQLASVKVEPGAMPLTRIPCGPSSRAMARVRLTTPAFAAT